MLQKVNMTLLFLIFFSSAEIDAQMVKKEEVLPKIDFSKQSIVQLIDFFESTAKMLPFFDSLSSQNLELFISGIHSQPAALGSSLKSIPELKNIPFDILTAWFIKPLMMKIFAYSMSQTSLDRGMLERLVLEILESYDCARHPKANRNVVRTNARYEYFMNAGFRNDLEKFILQYPREAIQDGFDIVSVYFDLLIVKSWWNQIREGKSATVKAILAMYNIDLHVVIKSTLVKDRLDREIEEEIRELKKELDERHIDLDKLLADEVKNSSVLQKRIMRRVLERLRERIKTQELKEKAIEAKKGRGK